MDSTVAPALSERERSVLRTLDGLVPDLVAFTRDLVRIPTVNPPGDRYADCAALVADRLHSLGYAVERFDATGLPEHSERYPRPNVVGTLPPQGGAGAAGPTLHFNGHYDVVPAGSGWTVNPFAAEIRQERIYGRGACDQKAGIAASIYAVEAIRRAGVRLAGTVEQSATADEESGGFAGVAWLCDVGRIARGRQDYVVITEPLDPDRVCVGHRGVYWAEITTIGQTGHGSMPGLAVNAVELMSRFIQAVEVELRPVLRTRQTAQPVEPPTARQPTIDFNAVHGGQPLGGWLTPVVPDRCTVVVDRRYIAEERFEDVRTELVNLLETLAARDRRFRYEIRDLMRVDPVVGDPAGRLTSAAAETVRSVLWTDPPFVHSPGTYDQKHVLRRAGIEECIAYGPGRLTLAHQPDEYVAIDDLVASARVMAVLTMRLLGVQE